jgi:drug/metabolite transporter (DMT)-like permease
VALAATDIRELKKGLRAGGPGPLLALVPMVGFGIAIAGVTYMAGRYQSFLLPILALRCCIFVQMAAAAGAGRRRVLSAPGLGVVLAAGGVGLLDTGSLLALAQGMVAEQGARVALLGPLYGAYPVVTVLLTQLFLREKLVANQWAGVGLVLFGTVLIATIPGG